MKFLILFFSVFISFFSSGFSLEEFTSIVQEYHNNSGIKMNFQKKVHLKLLKKNKTSKGTITLSKGRFILKIEDKRKSTIIFNGKNLLYITDPPDEEKRQVLQMDPKTGDPSSVFLSFLFTPKNFVKKVKLVSSLPKGRTWILKFEILNPESQIDFFSVKTDGVLILQAMIKRKNKLSTQEYIFSNIRRNQNIPPSAFQI